MTILHLYHTSIMSNKQNVLILGGGGREHAIAWKIAQSPFLGHLHITPGNGGTHSLGTQVALDINDFEAVANYALNNTIDIIIVGPEDPLVNGISDYFKGNKSVEHIFVFGPSKQAAQLEGSKDFSKKFMISHGIPTAAYHTFVKGEEAKAHAFLETMSPPYVLKADGLAAGKGVLILSTLQEAKESCSEMLAGKFGTASERLVIEEFLDGMEVSYFALCDGNSFVLLPEAKDYKRIGEGDMGLNTGGMGAVSPVPFADEAFTQKVTEQIIKPTVNGLIKENIPYVGFLFFGLIKVNGEPKVIEYNCRMGDPETEVVLPRLQSDLLEAIVLAKSQSLDNYLPTFTNDTATTVIAVSGGYPESYEKGKQIQLDQDKHNNKQLLFHAGTTQVNQLKTSGGRVLACTGIGNTLAEALQHSYSLMDCIQFDGMNYRKDIGQDLMNKNYEQ